MSRFVAVQGGVNRVDERLTKIFDRILISLGKAFTSDSFNFDTTTRFGNSLNIFKNRKFKLYIDSGGYSVIVGDIKEYDIEKLIHQYAYFIENFSDKFDFVFSLDIPLSLVLDINYFDRLLELNRKSQELTISVLNKNKELKNKIFFVWQFKTRKQFEIWKRIYEEFEIWKHYKYYSVGGIVGLRKLANISFSGYTVPFIYVVYEYLDRIGVPNDTTYYHILGQYTAPDQLTICVLENYAKIKYGIPFKLTYDSSSVQQDFSKIKRNFKDIFFLISDDIVFLSEIVEKGFNDRIIEEEYNINLDAIVKAIRNNERFDNSKDVVALYGLYLVSREKVLEQLSQAIIDILCRERLNIRQKKEKIRKLLICYSTKKHYKYILTNQFNKVFINNMLILLNTEKYDPSKRDEMMYRFIDLIGLEEFIK